MPYDLDDRLRHLHSSEGVAYEAGSSRACAWQRPARRGRLGLALGLLRFWASCSHASTAAGRCGMLAEWLADADASGSRRVLAELAFWSYESYAHEAEERAEAGEIRAALDCRHAAKLSLRAAAVLSLLCFADGPDGGLVYLSPPGRY
jgi:hypothetical protein